MFVNSTLWSVNTAGKLVKLVPRSRHQILRLKCAFCWGSQSAPDPAGGAYSAPSSLSLSKGPTSKGLGETGKREEKVKGKDGERWREGFGPPKNFGVPPPVTCSLTIALLTCFASLS